MRTIRTLKEASITTKMVVTFLIASWLALLYVGLLLLYPFRTIEVKNDPYPILNSPVEAGQIVVYEVDSCRYTDLTNDVTRTLVGEVTIQLNRESQNLQEGCSKFKVASTIIPSFAPAGTYHIEISNSFRVNALRTIEKRYRTVNFEIKRPPKGEDGKEIIRPPEPVNIPSSEREPILRDSDPVAPAPLSTPPKQPRNPDEPDPNPDPDPPDEPDPPEDGVIRRTLDDLVENLNDLAP